jgi:hypothetical protein
MRAVAEPAFTETFGEGMSFAAGLAMFVYPDLITSLNLEDLRYVIALRGAFMAKPSDFKSAHEFVAGNANRPSFARPVDAAMSDPGITSW